MVNADNELGLHNDREVRSRDFLTFKNTTKLWFTDSAIKRSRTEFRGCKSRDRQQLKPEFHAI